jgi:hypothetical protein
MTQKRNIAIVCGGYSSEHEVSLRSAQGIYSFFDKERYNVYIVEISKESWWVNVEENQQLPIDKNNFSFELNGNKVVFDYAYITIHGTPGENGLLQGYFDMIQLPYSTSGVLVEAMTFNKFVLNNYLRGFGYNVAKSMVVYKDEAQKISAEKIESELGMPCFIKPAADGSSFGVSKVKSKSDIPAALELSFNESNEVMIESFLQGTEISIGCYATKEGLVSLPATEVVTENEFFDYNAKYNGQVQEITPARLHPDTAERVANEVKEIYSLLRCNGIIRIDYIISKDSNGKDVLNLLEINTTPGMTATSFIPQQVRAAGLNMTDVLTNIVERQF